MKNKKILVGLSGSFCNHKKVLQQLKKLTSKYELTFVLSHHVSNSSTRFMNQNQLKHELLELSPNAIIESIVEAEKIGPDNCYDLMLATPCTATQCAKFVHGIYDDPFTLAMKAMIRNQKNIVVGFASNDGLGISGMNVFHLLTMRYMYMIPFAQDDPIHKPNSIVAKWELLEKTVELAFQNQQLQPVLRENSYETL